MEHNSAVLQVTGTYFTERDFRDGYLKPRVSHMAEHERSHKFHLKNVDKRK